MENDTKLELELDEQIEEGAGEGEGEAKPKPKLTSEQIQGIKRRQFTRLAKELGIELPSKSEPVETFKETQKEGFDDGQLALLKASGIKLQEHDFVEKLQKETGKKLADLLETSYFQSSLREVREKEATSVATPEGTRPGSSKAEGTVEFWLGKGYEEFPEDPKLARDVLKARESRDKHSQKFAHKAVV